ncbi:MULTISPECIES: pyridoxamine 5'-phosphate oxidase family protein [Flagellimonas]|uniref:Flavin mononucleotide-binding protein n=1 Tax=Flagellimonas sediminis TaxID=2696468 RepID=A0A6I5KW53_9FLAO|nr:MULTISPECIES: pyridoxamine 5'-phosphate oxidase family protein [Allomuricauda]NDV45007.1 flavin mononucleotide-binding protein [Allomuricauda sediminis]
MTDLTTSAIGRVLRNNYLGHLAYLWQGKPYVIPITYYFDPTDNTIISYTSEGHKIDAMRKNNSVTVQVEEIQSMFNWESAMVHGTFEELEGSVAKQKLHLFTEGVKSIIRRKERREVEFINEFSSKIYSRGIPIVYRIKIQEVIGKRRET